MKTGRRLDEVYRNARRIRIDKDSRIVCMSDCHRGVGNHGDNFPPNQNVFFAALPRPGKSLYLNDGSCVHPRCITAMEIEGGRVTLVKWSVMVRYGRQLSVEREVLEGPMELEAYF